jgi:thermostable 8-oxoguanine DNA glycosylase
MFEEKTRQEAGLPAQERLFTEFVWTIDSKTHAAPSVTMHQYEKVIKDGFLNASLEHVKGIVDAYELRHRTVLSELISLSQGQLKTHLDDKISDWQSHDHVSPAY